MRASGRAGVLPWSAPGAGGLQPSKPVQLQARLLSLQWDRAPTRSCNAPLPEAFRDPNTLRG
eukprot:3589353-Alexandrium_andersonii.AAC.1